MPDATPVGLSDEFAGDRSKQQQWQAFQRGRPAFPPPITDVVSCIKAFLMPPMEALSQGRSFDRHWPEGDASGL